MFIGHYGPSYAIKAFRPRIPMWLLFIAVQFMDVVWSVLVLLGIEKVQIVPGTLDLYYMPYTQACIKPPQLDLGLQHQDQQRAANGLRNLPIRRTVA